METRANLAAVGIFVLAVVAAGFAVAYWMVVGGRTGAREQVVIVFPGSVGGLIPGANVSFNGIKVGEIVRLDFAPEDPNRVVAVASIRADTPIKRDSRAALAYQGLTGIATVSIYGGTKDATLLLAGRGGDNAVLFADASGVQDLVEGTQRVIGQADATLAAINELVRDNRASIDATVKNAEAISGALAKNAGNIERFMADVGRAADVLAKVSGKVEALVEDLDRIATSVEPAKVRQTVENVAKLSTDLAKSSGEIETVVREAQAAVAEVRKTVAAVDPAKIKATVDGVAEFSKYVGTKTQDLEAIVKSSKSAAANVDAFTADLSRKVPDIAAIIDDFRKMASRVEVASQRIDGILAKVDGLVGSAEGKGLLSQGQAFLEEATFAARALRESAMSVQTRVGDIAEGINRFTAGGMREVRDLIGEGRRTLGSIERAVTELDKNPSRILFGGGKGSVPDYGPGRR